MSDTKLDDETERLIDEYGTAEFWNGRFMDNGGTPKAEALAALRDRVRELVTDAYSRGTYDTQMRYAGTD